MTTLGQLEMFLDEFGAEIMVPMPGEEAKKISLAELTDRHPKLAELVRAQYRVRFIDTGWVPSRASDVPTDRPFKIQMPDGTTFAADLTQPMENCSVCNDPDRPAYGCVACIAAGDAKARFCRVCGGNHRHPVERIH